MMNVAVSDWVVATTREDELVHGFVEAIATPLGIGYVYVIASDRDTAIGQLVEVNMSSVRKLPVSGLDSVEQVKSLIDIALSVRDEAWFGELSEQLQALQAKGTFSAELAEGAKPVVNRIGADRRLA